MGVTPENRIIRSGGPPAHTPAGSAAGWAAAARTIIWLRGDPQGVRVLREASRLVAPQGYQFLTPPPGARARGDVLVAPLPGSPEEEAYRGSAIEARHVVVARDAWTALALAVAAPRRVYRELLVGIDPGRMCAYTVIGDGVLLHAARAPCGDLAPRIEWITSRIPHTGLTVNLGGGPGAADAAASLDAAGIPYSLIDERGTSGGPGPGPLARDWMDPDTRAALAIALLGRYRRLA